MFPARKPQDRLASDRAVIREAYLVDQVRSHDAARRVGRQRLPRNREQWLLGGLDRIEQIDVR